MIPVLEEKSSEVAELCRELDVEHLDVFGSAVTGKFRPEASDIDFIASFRDRDSPRYLDRLVELSEGLERIFGRRVDLLTEQGVRNPRLRANVDANRRRIYES